MTPITARPHNVEAEQACLGSVLINSPAMEELGDLTELDFYIVKHQYIYRAFRALRATGTEIDALTVTEQLERAGKLGEVGGVGYLTQLINACPTSINAANYVDIVREEAARRALLDRATEIAKAAYDHNKPVAEICSEAVVSFGQLAEVKEKAEHISAYTDSLAAQIDAARKNPRDIFGVPTGFVDLDKSTGGLEGLVYITGKTGRGKSVFANQLALTLAHNATAGGCATAVYSMEMQRDAVLRRWLANLSRVPTRAIRSGRIDDEQAGAVAASIAWMNTDYNLFVSSYRRWTTASLRADLWRLKNEHGVKFFVLDYMEKIKDEIWGAKPYERSAEISDRLQDMVGELGLTGVVIQRLNKEGQASTTAESYHMAGSMQLAFDSDLTIIVQDFIPKNEVEKTISEDTKKNLVTLTLSKVREEASARYVHLVKDVGFPAFKNYSAPRL